MHIHIHTCIRIRIPSFIIRISYARAPPRLLSSPGVGWARARTIYVYIILIILIISITHVAEGDLEGEITFSAPLFLRLLQVWITIDLYLIKNLNIMLIKVLGLIESSQVTYAANNASRQHQDLTKPDTCRKMQGMCSSWGDLTNPNRCNQVLGLSQVLGSS